MPWNMMSNYSAWGPSVGFWSIFFWPLIVWSLVWKGLALWKAAREGEKWWFVALLIINTMGILEILYIYVFAKKKGLPKV
jgi:hypothetical protein